MAEIIRLTGSRKRHRDARSASRCLGPDAGRLPRWLRRVGRTALRLERQELVEALEVSLIDVSRLLGEHAAATRRDAKAVALQLLEETGLRSDR